ncbi:MAG: hypothetical protein IPK94_00335 [Saprospiraceae bacterium]|nr:hypothetical protein [Saprospiraceae bacterium]
MKYNESVKNYRTDQKLTDPTTSRGDGDKNLVDFQLDVFDEVCRTSIQTIPIPGA